VLQTLRAYAIARSLFPPTTLQKALRKLGFVQADPIRAPARAQDLILRPRVKGYRAGDLERKYRALGVEEDFFINYGFVTRDKQALMHPRVATRPWTPNDRWSPARWKRAMELVAHVRERGEVHPSQVDERFAPGRVTNAWGGSSNAVTQLLDGLHYRGLLRITRRDNGLRVYGARDHVPPGLEVEEILDALVDWAVGKYAPLPAPSLSMLVSRLRYAVPQHAKGTRAALARAKQRLASQRVGSVDWYWPVEEKPEAARSSVGDEVRLLAPFDPVVWDRRRFELLFGWPYRFEAYTPVKKRKLGYYALPLLWREQVIGWGNLAVAGGALNAGFGFVSGVAPKEKAFARELDAELERMRVFLGLRSS
jgi:uncharacterized protein YcaQ